MGGISGYPNSTGCEKKETEGKKLPSVFGRVLA